MLLLVKIKVIAVGDVVVIYDHDLPRTLWRLWKVEELIRWSCQRCARVNNGTKNASFLKQPIQHHWKCAQKYCMRNADSE